jgi:hypothetical protein
MAIWQGMLAAASGGALAGGAVGLVPLVIGLLRRKAKIAVGVFTACVVGGAVGGIYAAVAAMGVGLAILMRSDKIEKPIEPH